MQIRRAGAADAADLAALLWRSASESGEPRRSERELASDLVQWCAAHEQSHVPFLALLASSEAVGMAWLAVVPRVPRPDSTGRLSGDIQSMYVVAAHRSEGVGSALLSAALDHADRLGLEHVTVHSSPRATSLYERHGFTATPELLLRRRTQQPASKQSGPG